MLFYRIYVVTFLLIVIAALVLPKYEHMSTMTEYRRKIKSNLALVPDGLEFVSRPHGRMLYDYFPKRICHVNRFYDNMLVDQADLLTIRHCLEIDNQGRTLQANMERFATGGNAFYTKKIEIQTGKMADVYGKIQEDLKDFSELTSVGGKIQGPVLLLLFQAPYYRDSDSNVVTVTDANVYSYNYQPHIILNRNVGSSGIPEFQNYILAYLLFPMHTTTGAVKNISNIPSYLSSCLAWLRSKKSESPTCKVRCLDDSSTFCGCLNTTGSSPEPYVGKCAKVPAFGGDTPLFHDYGMVYRINERSQVGSLFTSTYINDLDLDS